MQHFIKKAAALALAMVMALSLASVAFAADFPDMPDDWSTAALEAAVENGLISGKDGKIAASDNLTRAEMATIITRAFGAEVEDDISFADVKNDAWYKSAVAKAVHMGAMGGVGSNNFAGAASITRQEVFVVLARVLKLADGDAADLATFSDADKTATWAVPAVAALVKSGYVSGSNGALNPTANITRAEFSQVMYNIFHNAYLTKAGTYEEVDGDNVIISSTNVTVKGVDVKGDVVIADGVGDGDVFFEDVTIGGRLVVRGGGMNSVHFKDSKVGTVIMSKVDGNVRLVVTGESTVETVTVEAGKASTDVRVEGTVGTVVVNDNASTVVLADATVAKVEVNKANTTVSLAGKTVVAEMTVAAGATGTNINAEPNTEITKLDTAEELTINNEDAIKDCNDEEKVNPEKPEESGKPEESKAPSEDTGSTTEKHTHTFLTENDPTVGKPVDKATRFDAEKHSFTCSECGEIVLRPHELDKDGNCTVFGCTYTKPAAPVTPGSDATGDGVTTDNGKTDKCNGTHTFDDEHRVVTPANGCKDGKVVYSCTVEGCSGTKTAVITATGDHVYGPGAYASDAAKPTCGATGTLTYTCKVCGDTSKTSTVAKLDHTPAAGWKNDPTNHWKVCTSSTNHAANTKIDSTEAAHTWGKWVRGVMPEGDGDAGKPAHKHSCTICGYESAFVKCELTAGNNFTCPDCGYSLNHKDTYTPLTDTDAGYHSVACNQSISEHVKAKEACTYVNGVCSKCKGVDAGVHALTAYQYGKTAEGYLGHRMICKCSAGASCTVCKPSATYTKCTFDQETNTKCVCGQTHTTHRYDKTAATGKCIDCGADHSCNVTGVAFSYNTLKHWQVCPDCGKHVGEELHSGGTEGNMVCTDCGQTYAEHTCSYTYTAKQGDGEKHVKTCAVCGASAEEACTFSKELANTATDSTCTKAGHENNKQCAHCTNVKTGDAKELAPHNWGATVTVTEEGGVTVGKNNLQVAKDGKYHICSECNNAEKVTTE